VKTGQKLQALCSDREGRYNGREVAKYFQTKGISTEWMTADTPQHDGISECMNRMLAEKVLSILSDADLVTPYGA
jgi:hypothetical protein